MQLWRNHGAVGAGSLQLAFEQLKAPQSGKASSTPPASAAAAFPAPSGIVTSPTVRHPAIF